MASVAELQAAETRALEEVGCRLWVAPESEEVDGWLLRCAGGFTGRANSVLPNAAGVLPLAEKIDAVEAWYAARGLPARFQLTAASLPRELEAVLRARGYAAPAGPVSVQTAAALQAAAGDARVELAGEPSAAWVELWAGSRGATDVPVVRALLCGSPGRTVFARLGDEAVGRAVAVDGWLGVTSMFTVPSERRRGLGRAVLRALLAWGRSAGAVRGYVQTDNPAAAALYAQFGFRERYAYGYLVQS
jgi:GNAT superfamily N-acetyltransferase